LGQKLVRVVDGQCLSGLIVETEAYLGAIDAAAHTFNGRRTARNASMWLGGGTAYVYFTYGMHYCLNVVAGKAEQPVAVLLRALQPTEGVQRMFANRPAARRERDLCSGPGKLCQALAIDRRLDGADLITGDHGLFLQRQRRRGYRAVDVEVTRRVGVSYAGEWAGKPLRFYLKGSPYVSRPWIEKIAAPLAQTCGLANRPPSA
jgi:DNA-3-methyladenine glycosylase